MGGEASFGRWWWGLGVPVAIGSVVPKNTVFHPHGAETRELGAVTTAEMFVVISIVGRLLSASRGSPSLTMGGEAVKGITAAGSVVTGSEGGRAVGFDAIDLAQSGEMHEVGEGLALGHDAP